MEPQDENLISHYDLEDFKSGEINDLSQALRLDEKEEYEGFVDEYNFPVDYPEDENTRERLAQELRMYQEGVREGRSRQKDHDAKFILSMLGGTMAIDNTDEIGSFLSQRSPEEVQPVLDAAAEVPELGVGAAAFMTAYAVTWKSYEKILGRD